MPPDFDPIPIVMSGRSRKVLGLNMNLWRLAFVTGVAQFSMSLWAWEFSIFLEFDVGLLRWQIGSAFSIGTLAMIIGYAASGIIADFIGRKNTMVISFIPMAVGLLGMWLIPTWPFVAIEYGITYFGWASILVITTAIPADEIEADGGSNSARTFTMVLLPAFLVDGLSPVLASILLENGYSASILHLIASIGAVVALFATMAFVRESLDIEIIKKARKGPIITIRGLGKNFWKFVIGISGFIFFLRSAVPYLGNLVVGEWGLTDAQYGYAWAFYSMTSAIVLYFAGTLADRNVKVAQIVALLGNSIIVLLFSVFQGFWILVSLNIAWALPVALWIGAENTIVSGSVSEEKKGRALGTYRYATSIAGFFAFSFGAYIWEISDSLIFLYQFAGIGTLLFIVVMALALKSIDLPDRQKEQEVIINPFTESMSEMNETK
ncbi:MFS transporter [Candidatus Thorarchaeota archaeon]|nr:MAG: MFS transporter [Candidatus Thorarchaeota archaeon]